MATKKLALRTIKALREIVTGDKPMSPYRSGPMLVSLFNEYGFNDTYCQGFPSRWSYVEEKLTAMNGTDSLFAIIEQVLDPREFLDCPKVSDPDEAIKHLNARLNYDGFEVVIDRGRAKLRDLEGATVEFKAPFGDPDHDHHRFIGEQVEKAEKKILDGDYDGAITNARSLIEGVLRDIETGGDPDAACENHEGDLIHQYKKVQKTLNLDPSRPDIDGTLKQVLSGLTSIVSGLAGLRNKMSDAHARSYKPSKHHAVLVVNAAKTVASFLYETAEHQAKAKAASEEAKTASKPKVAR